MWTFLIPDSGWFRMCVWYFGALLFWSILLLVKFMIQDPWHHHLGIDRSTLTLIESLRSILELWSWRCRMQGQETPRAGNTRGKRSHQYPGSNIIQQLILASPGAVTCNWGARWSQTGIECRAAGRRHSWQRNEQWNTAQSVTDDFPVPVHIVARCYQ